MEAQATRGAQFPAELQHQVQATGTQIAGILFARVHQPGAGGAPQIAALGIALHLPAETRQAGVEAALERAGRVRLGDCPLDFNVVGVQAQEQPLGPVRRVDQPQGAGAGILGLQRIIAASEGTQIVVRALGDAAVLFGADTAAGAIGQ